MAKTSQNRAGTEYVLMQLMQIALSVTWVGNEYAVYLEPARIRPQNEQLFGAHFGFIIGELPIGRMEALPLPLMRFPFL